jgi:hypothetical protein
MNQKVYQEKRLVNGVMDAISEIIWPLFRRAQLYDKEKNFPNIQFMSSSKENN